MKVSVVIPTYKPKDYIWECLDSLSCQTLEKSMFELILVLNGCDEPWREKIEAWISSHKDLNINFIQTDTPGVSNARNIGLEQAKGEYITFIDDDDYVSSEYLQRILESSDKDAIVLADSRAFIDGKKSYVEYVCHNAFLRCAKCDDQNLFNARTLFNGPCMKLFPKCVVHDIFFDTKFANGEDSIFMFEVSRNVKKLRYASETAIYYRRYRENSAYTSKKNFGYTVSANIKLFIKIFVIYARRPFSYDFPFAISRLLAPLKNIIYP